MPPPNPDEATAYHEAGHAVIALAHERPVHRVSLTPDRAEHVGICEFRKGVFRPSKDWLEAEMLIALAGLAAEARHTGHYALDGASRDLRYVRKLAVQRAGEKQVEKLEKRMLAKVENMLDDEGLSKAVELIAAELLKSGTLSGRAARHLYDQGCAE